MTPKQNDTNMPWEDPLHPLGPHHNDSGNFDQKIHILPALPEVG